MTCLYLFVYLNMDALLAAESVSLKCYLKSLYTITKILFLSEMKNVKNLKKTPKSNVK